MTGVVTGAETFVYLSYGIAGATLLALALYAVLKLQASSKKLNALKRQTEETEN